MENKVDLTTVQDPNPLKITECPYCGNKEYYLKYRYSGVGIYRYRFDKIPVRNPSINIDMYEFLKDKIIGNFAYCYDCDKEIFRVKD